MSDEAAGVMGNLPPLLLRVLENKTRKHWSLKFCLALPNQKTITKLVAAISLSARQGLPYKSDK